MSWVKKLIVTKHECKLPPERKRGKWHVDQGSRWECSKCGSIWGMEFLSGVGLRWERLWMPGWIGEVPDV